MTDYVTPTTWEQCAAHVEAGEWWRSRTRLACGSTTERRRRSTGGGAARRMTVGSPSPSPDRVRCPANGVPDVPTGAERYLAERLADPEYRAAYEAAAPVTGDDLRESGSHGRSTTPTTWKNANHPRLGWRPALRSADAVLAVLPPQPAPSPSRRGRVRCCPDWSTRTGSRRGSPRPGRSGASRFAAHATCRGQRRGDTAPACGWRCVLPEPWPSQQRSGCRGGKRGTASAWLATRSWRSAPTMRGRGCGWLRVARSCTRPSTPMAPSRCSRGDGER